jgi:iron(III) transport system ATP-binding protein
LKSFGTFQAVDDVSLEVAEGEFVTLLGPSGCGKSTTLRCIAGLETPTGGEIMMGGETVFSTALSVDVLPEKRRVGMVFQSYALWPHMSVLENVAYPLRRQKLHAAERDARAKKALDLVGLADAAQSAPGTLSGGQQQRIALARALASECRILLFDEPLSNLDVRLREQLRNEIREIQQRLGITAIYVTHDQSEALAISDRVVVMDKGKIIQIDTPAALYARPKNTFAASFLGKVNLLPVTDSGMSSDRKWRLFRDACGSEVRIPAAETTPVSGAALQLGVRSELVRLTADAGSNVTQDANRWRGAVEHAIFLGDSIEYLVRLVSGEMLKIRVPPYVRYDTGNAVVASIAPDDCFIIKTDH